ncbi:MAG: hypothetical protein M3R52_11065 [Acidobacteriota bacterium]|nr:hypothetical protein [Acidobacteriota bacterium]
MIATHAGKRIAKLTSRRTAAFLSFRALLTLVLIIGAPFGSVFSQQSQTNFAPLEKAALDELRETNTPGAANIAATAGQFFAARRTS